MYINDAFTEAGATDGGGRQPVAGSQMAPPSNAEPSTIGANDGNQEVYERLKRINQHMYRWIHKIDNFTKFEQKSNISGRVAPSPRPTTSGR